MIVPGWYMTVPGWYTIVPGWCIIVPGWYTIVDDWYMIVPDQCIIVPDQCIIVPGWYTIVDDRCMTVPGWFIGDIPLHITDLLPTDTARIEEIAALLPAAFAEHWPTAWPTVEEARAEVHESFAEERISLMAIGDDGALLGWIGGISGYDGLVWELHPLAVWPHLQGRGIGRALVAALEARVRERGGLTITVGSDDDDDMTSLSGVDLYSNLWEKIANIRNLRGHPYEFYQRCGFVITGVVPDANGPGKPDILMAKRVAA